MADTETALKQLEATGKIDTLGTTNPGWLIDLYNKRVDMKREKSFKNLMTDMNEYYFKLLIDTVKQRQSGVVDPIYKSNSVSLTMPDDKIIIA